MQLQRKSPPGNRNVASSVHCYSDKGWYSYLTRKEQKILNDPSTILASSFIPDDLVYGVSRSSISDISQIPFSHVQNTSMFHDGQVNSMEFQNIQFFRHVHTFARKLAGPVSNNAVNLSLDRLIQWNFKISNFSDMFIPLQRSQLGQYQIMQ